MSPSTISPGQSSAANQPNPSPFEGMSSFSFPTFPYHNPVGTTENMPSQAASMPSFFSKTPFTFPQVTPTSIPNNPFEIKPSSSGAKSFGWGLHSHVPNSQCWGSLVAPYVPTLDSETGRLVSISAMPAYSDKSHEELRAEDYKLRNWRTEKPFEFSSSSTSRAPTDPSQKYSLFVVDPFPSGPLSGGTSSFSSPTTPFTFPQPTSTSVPKNPFEMKPSSSGLHNHIPNSQCQGSCVAHYVPTPANEFGLPTCNLISISAMPAYSDKSHEELRAEDYKLRNWRAEQTLEFSFTLGASTDQSPKYSLFGGPSSTCGGVFSSSKCGFQSESSMFGSKSSTNQQPSNSSRPLFGGMSSFSFPTFPHCNPISTAETTPSEAASRLSFFSTMPFTFPQVTPASIPKNPFEIRPSSSGKSHEELRSEDYKLRSSRSKAKPFEFSSTSRASTDPSPKYSLFEPESSLFGSKSSNQQTSSPRQENIPTSNPFGQPHQPGNYGVPFDTTTLPGFGQPYKPGNHGFNWSSPSFGTTTLPGFNSHNAGSLSSSSQDKTGFRGSSVCNQCNDTFASPCWPITGWPGWGTPAFVPCFHHFPNAPSIWGPFGMGFFGVNPSCGPHSTPNTSVPPTDPDKVPNTSLSFGSPIEVSEGGPNEPQPTKTESKPATTGNDSADHADKGKADNVMSVPKGLEIIVEKLGVNPWAEYPTTKEILPCEEADEDEAIVALAEFAVEQHNAMNQGSKVSLTRVVGACLEAVECGRYHIAIETKDATDKPLKRFYVVVLQRRTDLQTLILLEKWLSGEPKSGQESSM